VYTYDLSVFWDSQYVRNDLGFQDMKLVSEQRSTRSANLMCLCTRNV